MHNNKVNVTVNRVNTVVCSYSPHNLSFQFDIFFSERDLKIIK